MSLARAVRAEWFRLRSRRWAAALGGAALAGGGYAGALSLAVDGGLMGAKSGFYLLSAACSGAALTAAAAGALAAASAVGGDLGGGLVRTVFSRSLSRAAWLAGRVLALGGALACLFLAAGAGALLVALARYGFQGASEGDYVIAAAGVLGRQLVVAVALSLLAQLAALALGGGIGALVGRPGTAVVAVALAGAALIGLGRWRAAERFVPVGTLTEAFDRLGHLAQGMAGPHPADGALAAAAGCVLWIAGGITVGALALTRGDIVT